MKIVLQGSKPTDIRSTDMKDGDVGVITKWGTNDHYVGRIVQRYRDNIVSIGLEEGCSWSGWCSGHGKNSPDCQVRLLKSGDVLEVQ